jgi:hypothetical protein
MSAKKFEKLIALVINEDQAKAEALFHDIIVEKSREIYESIMAEDQVGGFMDEIEAEETGEMMEADEEEFETGEEIDGDFDVEGGDDMDDEDMEFDDEEDFSDEEDHHADFGGEEELEDRVVDLEDKLDQLMADFEAEMGGDMGDDEDMEFDAEEEFDDEDGEEEFDAEEDEEVMESVQLKKVKGLYNSKIGGDNGEQTKSTVAFNSGKKGMEGTPVNYDAGGDEQQATGPKKAASYVTKGQKEVPGAKQFKNVVGKSNFAPQGEKAAKPAAPKKASNTRSVVPESKRTTKKRI